MNSYLKFIKDEKDRVKLEMRRKNPNIPPWLFDTYDDYDSLDEKEKFSRLQIFYNQCFLAFGTGELRWYPEPKKGSIKLPSIIIIAFFYIGVLLTGVWIFVSALSTMNLWWEKGLTIIWALGSLGLLYQDLIEVIKRYEKQRI